MLVFEFDFPGFNAICSIAFMQCPVLSVFQLFQDWRHVHKALGGGCRDNNQWRTSMSGWDVGALLFAIQTFVFVTQAATIPLRLCLEEEAAPSTTCPASAYIYKWFEYEIYRIICDSFLLWPFQATCMIVCIRPQQYPSEMFMASAFFPTNIQQLWSSDLAAAIQSMWM